MILKKRGVRIKKMYILSKIYQYIAPRFGIAIARRLLEMSRKLMGRRW